jgi:hypothetical protein
MTIEEFRATRVWTDDLPALLVDIPFGEDRGSTPRGWVYLGDLYIEQVLDDWPEETRAFGGWYLLIANSEYVSNDLARLEGILFEWAVSEGYDVEHAA